MTHGTFPAATLRCRCCSTVVGWQLLLCTHVVTLLGGGGLGCGALGGRKRSILTRLHRDFWDALHFGIAPGSHTSKVRSCLSRNIRFVHSSFLRPCFDRPPSIRSLVPSSHSTASLAAAFVRQPTLLMLSCRRRFSAVVIAFSITDSSTPLGIKSGLDPVCDNQLHFLLRFFYTFSHWR